MPKRMTPDALASEGSKRIVAALVKKYGPFELTVSELTSVDLDPGRICVDSTGDGFRLRYEP